MKKLLFYITFLFVGVCFSQSNPKFDYPSIDGNFTVQQILVGKSFYYINVENDKGVKILILQDKPKRRDLKKYKKNSKVEKLELGKNYFLKLQSRTWSIGYLPTGSFMVDSQEIWNRKTSDFNVCYAENLLGLYYIPEK